AIVAMKIFIEHNVVAPVGIILEFPGATVHGAISFLVPQENALEPARNLPSDLEEVHVFAGPGGAFDFEIVAIKLVEVEQPSYQETVDGHPDRPAPVRISAEHAGVGLRRKILNLEFLVAKPKAVRVILMVARERSYPVWAEEFVLVQHIF